MKQRNLLIVWVILMYSVCVCAQSEQQFKAAKQPVSASLTTARQDSVPPQSAKLPKTAKSSSSAKTTGQSEATSQALTGAEVYNEALGLYKKNDFTGALQKGQQATTLGMGADAFYLMALCHTKLESDKKTELRAYEAVLQGNPTHFKALTQVGILHYNQKEFAEAMVYFEKALTVVPSDKSVLSYLEYSKKAAARIEKGKSVRFATEKPKEKEVKEGSTKNSEFIAHYNEGVKAMNTDNFEAAILAFEKAAASAPSDAKTQYLLANALSQVRGEEERAIKAAKKASVLNETDGKLQFEIGNIFFALAQKEETVAAYKRAYKLGYKEADLYQQLGIAFYYMRENEQAIKWFEEAIRIDSENATLVFNLGTSYLNGMRLEAAEKTLKKAIELDPKNLEAYYNLGSTLLQENKTEEALAVAKTGISVDVAYAKNYVVAAEAYKRQGNTVEYERHLREAKKLDPKVTPF